MFRLLLLFGVLLVSACQSTNISRISSPLQASIASDLCADIVVGNDISGEENALVFFGLFSVGANKFADGVNFGAGDNPFGDANGKVKAAAAYQAVTSSQADLILDPRYTIRTTDYVIFKSVNAVVEGKGGTVRAIKNTTPCAGTDRAFASARNTVPATKKSSVGTRYVIQIMGTGTATGAAAVISAHKQVQDLRYVRIVRNGKPWFVVVQGRYETIQAAKKALEGLPAALRQQHPFPRALGEIDEQP